jgi:hypothetical protein
VSPTQRYRLIEAIANLVPIPIIGCPACDHNGCASPNKCSREWAEDAVEVVERELQS